VDQTLARRAQEKYTEDLLALTAQSISDAATRAEAKLIAVDAQFEEYISNRHHQQQQHQQTQQEQLVIDEQQPSGEAMQTEEDNINDEAAVEDDEDVL